MMADTCTELNEFLPHVARAFHVDWEEASRYPSWRSPMGDFLRYAPQLTCSHGKAVRGLTARGDGHRASLDPSIAAPQLIKCVLQNSGTWGRWKASSERQVKA